MKKHPLRFSWNNKVYTSCLFFLGILLLGYIVFNSFELKNDMKTIDHARLEYQDYTRARSRLRDGSDILTENVRRYVTTGETKYRDEYFKEAFETKNREWGLNLLEQMSNETEISERIKKSLHDAMGYSVDLMNLEFSAMRLVATESELADPAYPKELREAKVSPEDLGKEMYLRKRQAIKMLFNDEYTRSKQAIYDRLDEGLLGAAQLADHHRRKASKRLENLWINQIISMTLFVIIFFLMLVWAEKLYFRRTVFFQQMLDTIPLMVYLKDRKTGRYIDYNRAFAEALPLFGLDDIKGKTDREALSSDTAYELEINDKDALEKETGPSVRSVSILTKAGQYRHFRTTKLGINGPNGTPCLLCMGLDMTEDYERQMNSEAMEEALINLQQESLVSSGLPRILEIIRRRLNTDYCYIARYDMEKGIVSIDPEAFIIRGEQKLENRISANTRTITDMIDRIRMLGLCTFDEMECARIRKLFRVDQVAPNTPRAVSHMALKLTVQGEFWGILSVASTTKRVLSDIDKRFLQKIVRILETSIERGIVYEALAKAKNEAIQEGNLASSILDLMPLPCVVKDPADGFRYIRCNRAYADLHHLKPGEIVGKFPEDFYADKSLEVIKRTDAEAMTQREIVHFEDTCLWGDCNRRVFLYWKLPIMLKDGRKLLFCVAQDITEVKQKINTEHFRNEITAFLLGHSEPEELLDFVAKRLIETLGCQHILLHRNDGTRQDWFPDNEHTYCNKCVDCPLKTADPALFSHNGNVVLNNSNISDFPLPENCPTRILIARQIFFEGDEWGKIGALFTGDAFESLGFCEELLEQVANVVSVCIERKERNMVIKRQNEEVIRINRQVQLARDRAVAAEKAKSYFFSCISHDIRTPLNAIIGYAELLKKGLADEKEQTGAYDAITMSGRALLQLVNDMIDLARLESDTIVIEPVPTDLTALSAKILHSFEIAVAGKPVKLHGEWNDALPYVEVDPKRLWQILFNLLDNAVRVTEEGEIALKLEFERDEDGKTGTLAITVSDTGSGMDEEAQKRILLPFASLAEEGRHEIGAGLGLTICRHLLNRMNGSIELRSKPGSGSAFDIRIPGVKFTERTGCFPRPGSLIDFHGKTREQLRVLIVDDVPLNISVLRAMLRKNGISDIVCSTNGKDALAKIRADVKTFDLVLTDLWMPEMDGRKMLQELRADPRFKSLNVIAITADVDAKDECMKLGFSDVIFKPVTLAKIINFLPPSSRNS